MRNPDRLDSFYDELRKIHKEHFPDWRFGQFMYNFMVWLNNTQNNDGFYYEEDKMLELFKKYVGEIK